MGWRLQVEDRCYIIISSKLRFVKTGKGQEREMNDAYIECLVKQKQSAWSKILRIFLLVLMVLFILIVLVLPVIYFFLMAIAAGFGAYLVNHFNNLEYEYLYIDRELVIDKILAKSRRKRVGTFSLGKVEIMAPINSHQLDSYRHRNVKEKDYSIGEELKPDKRYAMYYEGGQKIIFSPSEELVKVMRNVAPRKVFDY